MKIHFTIIFIVVMLISCGNDNINNRNKRNDKWAWWVDVKNENGKWIPLA